MTHRAIVVKLPQDATEDEWLQATRYAYPYRHTVTASHDDMMTVLRAGRKDSYVKLLWPMRQTEAQSMIAEAGYTWETPPGFDTLRLTLGHPFAYRYAVSSGFNAPRPYANGKHEGLDFVVPGPGSDKPVQALAMLGGVVDKVGYSAGGYGNYVRVVGFVDGFDVVIWYGHLDKVGVREWQKVKVGDALGEIGNTGNSTGEHLHVTVCVPWHGLKGYVVDDVVDPTPFVPSAVQVAQLPPYTVEQPRVNLIPYLFGDGRVYQVDNARGTTEVFQTQRDDAAGRYWQVKAWGDLSRVNYESFFVRDGLIYRDIDTSPGGGRYYRHLQADGTPGAPWLKEWMAVGERYTSRKRVQFYFESDCKASADNSGNVQDTIRFIARYNRLRLHSGVEVDDVIQLSWEDGGEDYWYARGYGLVQWMRAHQDANSPAWSAMSRMRPDVAPDRLRRMAIPCLT